MKNKEGKSFQVSKKVPHSASASSQVKYWAKTPAELWQELASSPQGLSQVEVEQRLESVGPNVLSARQVVTPFTRSQPSRTMMLVTLLVGVVTLVLPYSPLAKILDLKPLAISTLGLIAGIVVLYFISAELVKRWFYRRFFS